MWKSYLGMFGPMDHISTNSSNPFSETLQILAFKCYSVSFPFLQTSNPQLLVSRIMPQALFAWALSRIANPSRPYFQIARFFSISKTFNLGSFSSQKTETVFGINGFIPFDLVLQ
ncbi:hypothetical protein QQP08_007638 [Theobroma cacao]|nr:hypothetical protein QQP08_006686 [Theobroma cacao]WRX15151.1 hypothetical protein QQP08_007638 [Theobroma cacao]